MKLIPLAKDATATVLESFNIYVFANNDIKTRAVPFSCQVLFSYLFFLFERA